MKTKILFLALSLATLTACGGGGSGTKDTGSGNTDGGNTGGGNGGGGNGGGGNGGGGNTDGGNSGGGNTGGGNTGGGNTGGGNTGGGNTGGGNTGGGNTGGGNTGGGNAGGKYDPYIGTGDANYRLKMKREIDGNSSLTFSYKSTGNHTKISKIESGDTITEFKYGADENLSEAITTKRSSGSPDKISTVSYSYNSQPSVLTHRSNTIYNFVRKEAGCESIGGPSTTIDSLVVYNEDSFGNALTVAKIIHSGTYSQIKRNGSCSSGNASMSFAFGYDKKGRKNKFVWTDTAGDIMTDYNYSYDDSNRLIKAIGKDSYSIQSKIHYTYNSDGLMDTIKEYQRSSAEKEWELVNHFVLEYEKGNCFYQYPLASEFMLSNLTLCTQK